MVTFGATKLDLIFAGMVLPLLLAYGYIEWPWGALLSLGMALGFAIVLRVQLRSSAAGIEIRRGWGRSELYRWEQMYDLDVGDYCVVAVMNHPRFPDRFPYGLPRTRSTALRRGKRREVLAEMVQRLKSQAPSEFGTSDWPPDSN